MRTTLLVALLLVAAAAGGCSDEGAVPSEPTPGAGVAPSGAAAPATFQIGRAHV